MPETYQTLRPRDIRFDKEHGIETDDYVETDEFDIEDNNQSERYVPTYGDVFRALQPLFPTNIEEFDFIDIGAGKGRVVLLAAHFPFKSVIGIEFVPRLHSVMVENIEKYDQTTRRCREIKAIFGNALDYNLPNQNTVFYLFNPMKREALSALVDKIVRSYREHRRELILLFLNPNLNNNAKELFESAGIFSVELYDTPEFNETSPLPLLVCKTSFS